MIPPSSLATCSRACRWARPRASGPTRSSRGNPASPANPRRVEIPSPFSARRCPVVIPATSDRSSSVRLRSRHMSRHRQMAQCSTGSG